MCSFNTHTYIIEAVVITDEADTVHDIISTSIVDSSHTNDASGGSQRRDEDSDI